MNKSTTNAKYHEQINMMAKSTAPDAARSVPKTTWKQSGSIFVKKPSWSTTRRAHIGDKWVVLVDASGSRNGSQNYTFKQNNNRRVRKRRSRNASRKYVFFLWILDTKMSDLTRQKLVFRLVLVTKYDISVFREKASKMGGQREPKTTSKSSGGRPQTMKRRPLTRTEKRCPK